MIKGSDMGLKSDLETEVSTIFRECWSERDGTVVPSEDSIKLSNDGVNLNATILYADLSDSTVLVNNYRKTFSAEVYKAFLRTAARIIRSEHGVITAYDGDRVMAVFIGDSKNTSAVRTALKINYGCKQVIQPALVAQYPNSGYTLKHVCGIDTSTLLVARAGIRGTNDLVWIGRSANYAAKLCSLSDSHPTWITKSVYDNMHNDAKYSSGTNMWEERSWTSMNGISIYRSTYWWRLQ